MVRPGGVLLPASLPPGCSCLFGRSRRVFVSRLFRSSLLGRLLFVFRLGRGRFFRRCLLGGLFFSRSFHGFVCSHVLLLGGRLLCLGLIAVIMIMVMTEAGAVNMPVLISLNRHFQFVPAYRPFRDFPLVEQELDTLFQICSR